MVRGKKWLQEEIRNTNFDHVNRSRFHNIYSKLIFSWWQMAYVNKKYTKSVINTIFYSRCAMLLLNRKKLQETTILCVINSQDEGNIVHFLDKLGEIRKAHFGGKQILTTVLNG